MINKIKDIFKSNAFITKRYSITFLPNYIIRRGIYKKIKQKAVEIKGVCLDFGCGSKPYESLFENAEEYIGVDIEVSGHNNSSNKIDYYYDGKVLPFQKEKFDVIFSSEVFEHIFNIHSILPELNRVLKTKGLLLITIPFVWEEHEIPFDYGRYTRFGITHLLNEYNFKIISIEQTTSDIETIFQLFSNYVFNAIKSKLNYKFILAFIQFFLILPINLSGKILSKIIPNSNKLYLNNVIN